MHKVKELINGAEWKAAKGFNDLKPEVTVIIPTYRRGDNGLLKQCVESLLNQTFKNFELIIVDDASYDSTASNIEEFMKQDTRVACIRHAENIGLPAISTFEGYMKARADKVFFAFDDNEYKSEAIEVTYKHQKYNPEILVSYSGCEAKTENGQIYFGMDDLDYNRLVAYNYIPNGGLMVDKRVFEDIGWYDPHICITRLCDWDLLLRIGKKYKIHRINKILSIEKGIIQNDSIGNTHYLEHQLITEWMNINRNEKLKYINFFEYDVTEIPVCLSYISKLKLLNLLNKNFNRFSDFNDSNKIFEVMKKGGGGYLLVFNEYNASTELYFANLPDDIRKKIIILSDLKYYYIYLADIIINAKAVILSREIPQIYIKIGKLLKTLEIPYYYYTDDNFFAIYPKNLKKDCKAFLSNSKGVILTSSELIKYFNKNNLHDNIMLINPVISNNQFEDNKVDLSHFDKNINEINIVFASADRIEGFVNLEKVIINLSNTYIINLYCFKRKGYKAFNNLSNHKNVNIEFIDMEYSHNTFLNILKNRKIHFFLHPKTAQKSLLKNYKYKTLHFLINAYLTSSLVLMPDIEPYSELKQDSLLKNLIVSNDSEWSIKIERLLNDYNLVKAIFKRLEELCKERFKPDTNIKVLEQILNECPDVDLLTFSNRVNRLNIFHNNKLEKYIIRILKRIYNKIPNFLRKPAMLGYRILSKIIRL